jgi:hypothetical protein
MSTVMAQARKRTGAGTLLWNGKNQEEIAEFCGMDRLEQPAATFGHFWDGQVLLSVWTKLGSGDAETTLPVRVGETIVRDEAGRITVLGVDTSNYE